MAEVTSQDGWFWNRRQSRGNRPCGSLVSSRRSVSIPEEGEEDSASSSLNPWRIQGPRSVQLAGAKVMHVRERLCPAPSHPILCAPPGSLASCGCGHPPWCARRPSGYQGIGPMPLGRQIRGMLVSQ